MGTNIGFTFILIWDTGAIYLKHYVETTRKGLASGDPIIILRTDAVSIEKARVAAHLLARMVNTSLPSGVGLVLLDDHVRIVGLVIEVDAGTDQPFATPTLTASHGRVHSLLRIGRPSLHLLASSHSNTEN